MLSTSPAPAPSAPVDDTAHTPKARRARIMTWGFVALLLVAAITWLSWRIAEPPIAQTTGHELPEKPSIIVLPFENRSGQPDQDYFAEGFSTAIRTHLAKFPQLFVIARSTSLTFKNSPGTARGIGRELGVRYVLDGNLQLHGETYVVSTELIEAASEHSVWAEQFEFLQEGAFASQADLVQQITSTLHVVISDEEIAAVRQRPTDNPKAYDLYLRAEAAGNRLSAAGRKEAIDLLQQAVALDPFYLAAHLDLSGRYLGLWRFGGTDDPDEALRLARHHAERALEIDQNDYRAHFRSGMIHLFADHEHDLAYGAFQRALRDNPNDADILYNMGFLRMLMGAPDEAIAWNDKAKRINPLYPGWYNFNAALSHFFAGNYEAAILLAKTGIAAYPKAAAPRRILIASLVEAGRLSDAEDEVAAFLAIAPDFRLSTFRNTPFQHQSDQDRYFKAMRRAGLPD